ncbi:hypothetical protein L873DRAFT_1848865 [Choiromyces venosus 120613-1]|uniref:Uncharacterized protein n=1 Tax=Choiromyces venosus 120613-1 TaxID=1336337 RepID=A0A3N4J163_9PEZI|nr:hypothetical protein L873DRAFT_1848865 [Choiromyces venosus 120613-1]
MADSTMMTFINMLPSSPSTFPQVPSTPLPVQYNVLGSISLPRTSSLQQESLVLMKRILSHISILEAHQEQLKKANDIAQAEIQAKLKLVMDAVIVSHITKQSIYTATKRKSHLTTLKDFVELLYHLKLQETRIESIMTEKVKMLTHEEIWKATPKIKPSTKCHFQEKVFSAAKPDNQKWMKIVAAKWVKNICPSPIIQGRLIASKVSESRTTTIKWWLAVHIEFTRLYQNIEKLFDQILQEDQQNFCLSSDGTHSDVVEVLMDSEEGDGLRDSSYDGLFEIDEDDIIKNSQDSNETGIAGFYDGMEDESFLDYTSEI